MIEFIRPSTEFRPVKPRFWERRYGTEFLESEFCLLREFNQAKRQLYPTICGTVVLDARLGENRFLLVPAPTAIDY